MSNTYAQAFDSIAIFVVWKCLLLQDKKTKVAPCCLMSKFEMFSQVSVYWRLVYYQIKLSKLSFGDQ